MFISLKKITIIAENLLKDGIIRVIKSEGGTGYTITACEGEGSRGIHASEWEGRNIQVDSITDEETAHKILERISEKYIKNYALIAYMSDVEVVREDKFRKKIKF